jgi:hypothetical protein
MWEKTMICDKLSVALDDLEGGGSKFSELIQGSEWSWLREPFGYEDRISKPFVRSAGPLKLVLELNHHLRALAIGKPTDICQLRLCFTELSQVPSMANIGITPGRYCYVIHNLAEFLSQTNWGIRSPKYIFPNGLIASYLLTSMESSWCLIKEASDLIQDKGPFLSIHDSARFPVIRTPTLCSIPSQKHSHAVKLQVNLGLFSPGWDSIPLNVGVWEPDHEYTLGFSQVINHVGLWSEVEFLTQHRLENLVRESGLLPVLPKDYAASLDHMIHGIEQYVRRYCLEGNEHAMPTSMMPPPPTWLSVWKE